MPKDSGHKDISQIAHAEAALGAGRAYETPNEGRDVMFDNYQDLVKHNEETYGHHASKPSRGEQMDSALEAEDKEIIEKMNERKEQRQEAKKPKHPHGEQ